MIHFQSNRSLIQHIPWLIFTTFPFSDDGSCKHVTALMFAVVDFCDRNADRFTASCTDVKCQWTVRRKDSTPIRVVDLDYRKDRTKPKKPGPNPDNYKPLRSVNQDDILRIRNHMKQV